MGESCCNGGQRFIIQIRKSNNKENLALFLVMLSAKLWISPCAPVSFAVMNCSHFHIADGCAEQEVRLLALDPLEYK